MEPEVFQERIKGGETHPFDALVATAYEAYQAMLASSNTYDVPGLYWQASLAAHSKAPRALQGIEVLLLDGFDDFTPSQLRLLATLSKHINTIIFGINYEDVPNRQDLYTLSAKNNWLNYEVVLMLRWSSCLHLPPGAIASMRRISYFGETNL